MTTLRLAVNGNSWDLAALRRWPEARPGEPGPALLISYVRLDKAAPRGAVPPCRSWVLDSGAFSAYNSGHVIDLGAYVELCREVMRWAHPPSEIFALDVIGDWRASLRNTEAMWRAGVPAIPTYHYGEPPEVLRDVAASADKVGLGGMKRLHGKAKLRWAEQCMGRIWPKKVHALALAEEAIMLRVPFHSCDASSWALGPQVFGQWASFGGSQMRVKRPDLVPEVAHYLAIEQRVKARWGETFRRLGWEGGAEAPPPPAPAPA